MTGVFADPAPYRPGGHRDAEQRLPSRGRFIAVLCDDWDHRKWLSHRADDSEYAAIVEMLTVRMRHLGGKAWATWADGKYQTGQIMRAGDLPRNARLRDIKAWLLEVPGAEEKETTDAE